jgi:hypothetical protein
MDPIEEPDFEERIRQLVRAADPAHRQPVPPPQATAAVLRAHVRLHRSSFRGREREVASMRVEVASGGRSASGRARVGGAVRLLLYALVCGVLGTAAVDGVGDLAVHLLGRRTMVGAFAQLVLAATGVVVAGVCADRVLARLRHDWAAVLATYRPGRPVQKGTSIR